MFGVAKRIHNMDNVMFRIVAGKCVHNMDVVVCFVLLDVVKIVVFALLLTL